MTRARSTLLILPIMKVRNLLLALSQRFTSPTELINKKKKVLHTFGQGPGRGAPRVYPRKIQHFVPIHAYIHKRLRPRDDAETKGVAFLKF